uniref:Glucanase n=1 Tax=Saccharum hybrid cultivar R570 TaxID=131158 RepID=A0A059Q314_9POAL|nr:hypothetical protein SHCRBa_009_B01_F_40 [Saccharum hybrid cultivar R570]AGT16812.1 glucanase [Saccharum hybrid cultivar R570]
MQTDLKFPFRLLPQITSSSPSRCRAPPLPPTPPPRPNSQHRPPIGLACRSAPSPAATWNNLPAPQSVMPLLAGIGIGVRMRMYDADPTVLHAFARTGSELIVGVHNECLDAVADTGSAT